MSGKQWIVLGIYFGMALSVGCRAGHIMIGEPGYYYPHPYANGYNCQNNSGFHINIPAPDSRKRVYPMAPTGSGLLGPAKQDAYGPGIWSDGTGRPFHWRTQDGQRVPFGQVKPDAYGPGIGMDIYGRPVKAVPGQ